MIEGFEIGHHTADADGWLTGTTVVLARGGAVGGVDVRGGGPGTRETDLLHPTALIERVHAVVLTGGSAYGLAAADGVMAGLAEAGIGFPVGPEAGQVVPIVPAAVIFDLGRGDNFDHRPDASFGAAALAAATADAPVQGCVGAGTGAVCGGLKGGFGYAERTLPSGVSVAAAVVVNANGSAVDPDTGRLYAHHRGADLDRQHLTALQAAAAEGSASFATTIGVVLCDAQLTKAQCSKIAAVAHDGMARAIRPLHSMLDGDTVFSLATPVVAPPDDPRAALLQFNSLLAGAADVFTEACGNAMLAATSRGRWTSYPDLVPDTA
ncbi:P1 family peptidase [Microlunatus panaciterrae]|uniref:L-aminopeptidase/D-esterase-like protein n=1 Tax=Microlunatus panaciterrae TaxID=400768 RepID=A0ABS2RFY4_9ACTN|nr:L-aminopeptidase/D-esterase-like protein [Microlunatus panaciterrae]